MAAIAAIFCLSHKPSRDKFHCLRDFAGFAVLFFFDCTVAACLPELPLADLVLAWRAAVAWLLRPFLPLLALYFCPVPTAAVEGAVFFFGKGCAAAGSSNGKGASSAHAPEATSSMADNPANHIRTDFI